MNSPKCRLCNTGPAIRNSHVLSKLGYRRYVADQSRGGASIKLHLLQDDSKQVTREWFCTECERLFGEDYAARFLDGLKSSRSNTNYNSDLLRFIVSCSWRTCLFTLEDETNFANRKKLLPACNSWKSYLLGKADDISPYTQHAFVIQDETAWDERLGMLVAYVHDLVFTQIGPLLCFGLLDAAQPDDEWASKKSMIQKGGGKVCGLVANQVNFALTEAMRITIDHADVHCNIRVLEFSKSRNRTPARWSERKRRKPGG